jgi:hypothetical protein
MAESEHQSLLQNIRELKNQEPFTPFEIVLSSGDRYLINNGVNLVEMRTELFYAYPGSDRFVLIRMNQIVAVERPQSKRPPRRRAS